MSERITIAVKRLSSGTVVKVLDDGTKIPLGEDTDWAGLRAMADAEVEDAALSDPDAQPLPKDLFASARRVPRVKSLRRALSLTQEEFSLRYQVPLGTLRDWEQGRCEPDQPSRAYLKVIAHDPEGVWRALASPTPKAS